MKPTVVLVHGAWHGAWCFDRVMPLLEAAAVPAIAVDLPGHGKDAGPFTDLHGDAARVVSVLDGINGDVVLLGHSYGGAVVTEAGVHPAVKHVVYLCALALDEGESCASALLDESASLSQEGRPDIADGLLFHDDGTSTLTPSAAVACLYNDCDPDTVTWALANLGPHPMESFGQSPSAIAWRERPSTYVVCSEDMVVHPDLQVQLAKRCTQSYVWPTSHSPFASEPERVGSLLVGLAGGATD
ncbi:MAG TPA: alpha/beta hydrolase [Acidimicrobiales bacterium]|nr:alpha/beta hydrolase [Acidimicrobiales bacterium]